jgi:O-methyltransferase involved in polyketide biosynthesis
MVRAFIRKNAKCNIVYLGAGLETAYYRLNEQGADFYEIDLPDVIAARRMVLGERANERLIAGDIFDMEWTKQIDRSLPTLLAAIGVFQYFKDDKVVQFISNLKKSFPSAELIFDATNKTGVKYANKYVKKTGNADVVIRFYIDDIVEFSKRTETKLI